MAVLHWHTLLASATRNTIGRLKRWRQAHRAARRDECRRSEWKQSGLDFRQDELLQVRVAPLGIQFDGGGGAIWRPACGDWATLVAVEKGVTLGWPGSGS